MPLLEVSLPLDPLFSSSHWAWLLALCLATLATLSRLSLFSYFMDNPPISSFISSRHVKLYRQLAAEETPPSSEAELTTSKSNDAVCEEQAGSEKENPWSSLLQQCGPGEEDEEEEEEVEEEEVLPPWVSSLPEASRTHRETSRNHLQDSTAALEAPRACTSGFQATSWSQTLHRQISARAGIPWHCAETRMGMPLHHQARLPCVAGTLCNRNASKVWSSQELHTLQLLQVPNILSMISAIEVGIHDGFAHLGYFGGEIALWDVEKRVCLNRLRNRECPVAALFVVPSYPRVAIATGQSMHNQSCSIVSVWDDRCTMHSAGFVLSMSASQMKALECRTHELGIAGEGYVSWHDLRMLKGNPIMLNTVESLGKSAWGRQGKKKRGSDYEETEVKSVYEEGEEEADEFMVMHKMCSNYYDGKHGGSKRRCSFLINCLYFMCCLVQDP